MSSCCDGYDAINNTIITIYFFLDKRLKTQDLSDAELRRRLQAHNFEVPPITDITRTVLVKKLAQLDGSHQKTTKGKKTLALIYREESRNFLYK